MENKWVPLWAILLFGQLQAQPLITFFIRPYPRPDGVLEHITTPGLISQSSQQGIFAAYAGYIAISDRNGQIVFPRKQQQAMLYLLITPTIKPVMLIKNTVRHFELSNPTNAAYYQVTLQHDPQTGLDFWQVASEPIPQDLIIPLKTVIIFAAPDKIYVPLGITVAKKDPVMLLPDIYAKPGANYGGSALRAMAVMPFFRSLHPLYKKEPFGYSQLLTP